jgi:hypothetical protein
MGGYGTMGIRIGVNWHTATGVKGLGGGRRHILVFRPLFVTNIFYSSVDIAFWRPRLTLRHCLTRDTVLLHRHMGSHTAGLLCKLAWFFKAMIQSWY